MMYSVTVSKILMGTTVETTARNADINLCKEALLEAYKEMKRVENLLSYHNKNSEITRINSFSGMQPVKVSLETFSIIKNSINYSQRSKGLFDVSVGPVSGLWGFNDDNREIELPDSSEVDSALQFVNYKNIKINQNDTTVFLTRKGMKLDLGGIAKGYAIDRGAAKLKSMGVVNFILNAGGDIYASGKKDKSTQWTIGIKDPRNTSGLVATFNLENYAVATSGDYERYRIINGVRYHHILNPFDGYPGKLSESTTVIAPTAEEADAMATYLFLYGSENALREQIPKVPYLIISADGKLSFNSLFEVKYHPQIISGTNNE